MIQTMTTTQQKHLHMAPNMRLVAQVGKEKSSPLVIDFRLLLLSTSFHFPFCLPRLSAGASTSF